MLEVLRQFSDSNFISREHCELWTPELVWLHAGSDAIAAFCYLSILLLLVYFLVSRSEFPFRGIVWLFSAFIFACGVTHLISVWTLWHPNYWLLGLSKAITAGIFLYLTGVVVYLMTRSLLRPAIALLEPASKALATVIQERQRTETEQREQGQRLSFLVRQTPLAVIEWTTDLRVVDWNPAAEKMFGYSKSEALGRGATDLIVPETAKEYFEQFGKHLLLQRGGTRSTNENCTKDGQTIYCQWYNTPLIDDRGRVIGIASLCEDITEQKLVREALEQAKNELETRVEARSRELKIALRELDEVIPQLQSEIDRRQSVEATLKEREEQYRSVVENLKEVIFQTDKEGNWTFLNSAWSEITGASVTQTLGTPFYNYIHPDDRQRSIEQFQPLFEGKKEYCRHEVRYLTLFGDYRWIEVFALVTLDAQGAITGTCGTLYDITERHHLHMALLKRERYLAALVEVQRRLLAFKGDSTESSKPYNEVLEILGQVSGASRVYVFENHPPHFPQAEEDGENSSAILWAPPALGVWASEEEGLFMSQKAEWCAPEVRPETDNPLLQNLSYEDFFSRWHQILSQNEIVAGMVTEFPESERVILELQGVLSILVLPLMVNGKFFGFIGFDNCTEARPWEASEVDLLKSAATAVSLWYESFLAKKALWSSEATNRALLEVIPDALLHIRSDGTYLDCIPSENLVSPIADREILGKKVSEVLPPEWARAIASDIEAALRTGKVQVSEGLLQFEDEQHYYEVRTVSYHDNEVLTMVRDVSDRAAAQKAGARLEEQFRQLTENIREVFFLSTPNWEQMLYISPAYEEIWGRTTQSLYEQPSSWLDSVHPDDRDRITAGISHLQSERDFDEEYRIVRSDGSVRWVWMRLESVLNDEGQVMRLVGLAEDVTKHKQAISEAARSARATVASEAKYRALVEKIPAVTYVAALDETRALLYISPQAESLLGYPQQQWQQQPNLWYQQLHPDDRPNEVTALAHVIAKATSGQAGDKSLAREYRLSRAHGGWVWIRDEAVVVTDEAGNPLFLQGVMFDITQRKRAEAGILKALAKEKELSDLKSRFVSITSHEFRTPLTTILSTAELLEYYDWSPEEHTQQLHLIQDAVKQMLQVLEDLLFIGTADAGQVRFNPEPIALHEFCRELVAEIHQAMNSPHYAWAGQHTIALVCRGQTFFACLDKKLLRQLLTNLLWNAIKYSPGGGTVEFELTCTDNEAIFEIQDSGIGIPVEDQPRVFEFFHRGTNVGAIAGTGLGLAIVKQCVDLHKGHIAVSSEVGAGTRFTVTLPMKNHFLMFDF